MCFAHADIDKMVSTALRADYGWEVLYLVFIQWVAIAVLCSFQREWWRRIRMYVIDVGCLSDLDGFAMLFDGYVSKNRGCCAKRTLWVTTVFDGYVSETRGCCAKKNALSYDCRTNWPWKCLLERYRNEEFSARHVCKIVILGCFLVLDVVPFGAL